MDLKDARGRAGADAIRPLTSSWLATVIRLVREGVNGTG
jgi:hypothetical protein